MPVRRHLRLLVVLAVAGGLVALAGDVSGLGTGLMLLSPALALALPLLAGRYVGEETLERLAARRALPRRRVRPVVYAAPRRRPRATVARGGRLLAAALAERGPPARASAAAA